MRPRFTVLCLLLLALSAGPPPAVATGPNHPLLQRLQGVLLPPSFVTREPFKDACGVAVDDQGHIYLASYHRDKVDVMDAEGRRLAAIFEVDPPGANGNPIAGPCDLAVDSAGNLYVNNWHRNVVKFPPLPSGATTKGPGAVIDANHPTSVAVDPATDHLYVVARTHVAEYAPPVLAGDKPVRKIGVGSLGDGYGVAVSGFAGAPGIPATAGWLYVADAADDTIKVYDPAFDLYAPIHTIDGAGTPRGSFHLTDADLAVDPADGHLYIADNLQPGFEHPELAVHEFSARGHYRGRLPYAEPEGSATTAIDALPSSVAVAAGKIFVTSGNFDASELLVFGPAPPLQTRILSVVKSGAGSGTVARFPSGWLRCGTACEGELDLGSTLQLVATPDPHNRFTGWSGCKESIGNACVVKMAADVTVGAGFEPIPPQPLTVARSGAGAGAVVSSPAGIDCGGGCEGQFDEGSTVTLTAIATAGSRLASWSGCDEEPAANTCAVTMNAARSVGAEFEPIPPPPPPPPPPGPPQRTLAISSTGIGDATGRIVSDPAGIDCGPVCARPYDQGSLVTLVARPAPGSNFLGWGGCDDPVGNRCAVRLGTDKTVVAAFSPGRPGPLRVRRLDVKGAVAELTIAVPAAGTLTAAGKGLRPASALPLAAGSVTMRLRLNRGGLGELRRAKGHRLAVGVVLALTPFDGGERVVARKTVGFGQESGGR
jgi:DNA-binding beta-propeller fold protein YncE